MRSGHAAARLLWPLCCLLVVTGMSGCANKSPSGGGTGGTGGGTGGTASGPSGSPINVGEYGSLTGATSTFGTSTAAGVKLAVDQANQAGGVDGHPVNLVVRDDASTPDGASNVVKKLVTEDKVTAVLGEVASTLSLQAAPICDSHKVPMISPSSTNPKVTARPYIFRVCFIDPFQGYAEAKFAHDNLKAKKAAIMTETTSDYSTGLSQFFKDNFTKLGGTVVATANYSKGDLDYRSQLTTIKNAAPDLLVVPGYYTDIGPIARQARQIGLNVPLLGGDGWDSPKLVEGAGGPGKALEGSYFSDHYSVTDPNPAVQKFVSAFKSANKGEVPDSLAALGYDAAGILIDSMKRAGKPADGDYNSQDYRSKLRDQIAAAKDYAGVTGTITIGPDRNAVKPASILQIKGTDFNLVTTVAPPPAAAVAKTP